MLSKNEIKDIQSLYHKKQRGSEGLFIAEGPKLAHDIINSNYEIEQVYGTATWIAHYKGKAIPFTEINESELSRISNFQAPNEVVVIAKQKIITAEPDFRGTITLALDGIQDPGNMGTIIRIADWFGLSQIICSHDCVDVYNPKVVQSTMGSIAHIQCWHKDFAEWQVPSQIPVYGALLQGENIFSVQALTEGILIIGNEGKGIRATLLSQVTNPVTIPGKGKAESLNAAVAAGIILAQMTR